MSDYRSFQLNCECGYTFEATLWDSLNVTEEKDLKSKLLNGCINQIQCEKCKKRSYVEKHLLYHDMDQRLWVQMFPKVDRPKWRELEKEHQKSIKKNVSVRRYHFRLAFGQDELLEKIRIFDCQLDDRIVELLKLKIIEQDENLKNLSDVLLVFSQYHLEDSELHFKLTNHEKNLTQTLVIPFEHYEEILESKEHLRGKTDESKMVCQGMYISINKTRIFH